MLFKKHLASSPISVKDVFVSDICFHLLFVSYKPFIYISKFLVSIRKERKYISVVVKDLNCLQTLLYQEFLRSSTWKRKNRDANIDSWGISQFTCSKLAFVVGFISIYFFLFGSTLWSNRDCYFLNRVK